jgi:hypothetical protein
MVSAGTKSEAKIPAHAMLSRATITRTLLLVDAAFGSMCSFVITVMSIPLCMASPCGSVDATALCRSAERPSALRLKYRVQAPHSGNYGDTLPVAPISRMPHRCPHSAPRPHRRCGISASWRSPPDDLLVTCRSCAVPRSALRTLPLRSRSGPTACSQPTISCRRRPRAPGSARRHSALQKSSQSVCGGPSIRASLA